MGFQWAVPIIASILILGVLTVSPFAIADDDDDDDDNPCGIPQPPTGGSGGFGVSVGVYGTIAHPLDDDDDDDDARDDDDDARDDDDDARDDDDDNPCPPVNTPPTIGSVTLFFGTFDLTGFEAVPEITLTCVPNDVIDEDIGDIVSFTFSWFLDGTPIDTGDTHLVTDQLGELVCEVTPFDGTDFGEPVATSITVVLVSSSGCPPNCSGSGGTI